MWNVHVPVMNVDCLAGKKQNCYDCPIALAVQRIFPLATVRVGVSLVSVTLGKREYRFRTDHATQENIRKFDGLLGFRMKPYTATLFFESIKEK